jgi:ATP-binding cassette subfamily C protein LapB
MTSEQQPEDQIKQEQQPGEKETESQTTPVTEQQEQEKATSASEESQIAAENVAPTQPPQAENAEAEKEKKPEPVDSGFTTKLEDRFFDPLLECLVIMTQLKQRPYSADSLKAGLPLVDNRFTPELFIRAAERAGLAGRLVKRPIKKISSILMPAILLLADKQACILTEVRKDGTAMVIMPETGIGAQTIPLEELEKQYSGLAIFLQPMYDYEKRATEGSMFNVRHKSWFWGTIWRFKRYYMQIIFASLFINIFALASPLFVMNVYNRVVPNAAIDTLWVLALGTALVFGFDFIMRTLRGFFIDLAGKKIDMVLASNLFEQVLGTKLLAQAESMGVRANHIRDFENIRDFFTSGTVASIVDLPFVFVFLIVIWLVSGALVLIPIMGIPIMILIALLAVPPMNRAVASSFIGASQKHAIIIEALNNLEVIKSTTAEGQLLGRWEKYVGMTARAGMVSRFYSMLAAHGNMLVTYLVTVVTVIAGVYMIEDKTLTLGGLIAATMLCGRVMAPFSQVTNLLTRYQQTKLSLDALNKLMAAETDRPAQQKFLHRPTFQGDIELEDVVFRYPGQELDLFKGISFKVKAGEHVGVIGSMGSGKSTLQKLIIGFYQPISGAIRIDGTDISQLDPANLRRHIGYVPQEPKVFFGTARENIGMKAPWADDIEILNCAKISGADRFIGRHPAGYDMPIGENGKGLSGGQCQSITIARALLGSPEILLFDEPTSAMDNSSELLFINNMKTYIQNKTFILVTHKISLLELVDRLIVLQNGKIVADGPKVKVLEMLKQINKL